MGFTKYHLDEENKSVDSFTVKFNKEERKQHDEDKKIINQAKDSTAIKQLAALGSKVIHSPETLEVLNIVLENKRKNKRLGIVEFE